MRFKGLVLVVALSAAAISIAATGDQPAAQSAFDGTYVFERSCAGCHGNAGQGITLFGPPLVGSAFINSSSDDAIGRVITMGRKYRDKMFPAYMGMPRFQYITGGELQAVIDYIKGPLQGAPK